MIYEFRDYRSFLKEDLAQRIRKKPAYSLRAHARYIGMQPSLLSGILAGKRNLTETKALELGTRIGLQGKNLTFFRALVSLGRAKTPQARLLAQDQLHALLPKKSAPSHDLSVDAFVAMADWQHFALMKAFDIPEFVATADTLARGLGVKRIEIEACIDRLIRLEILERTEDGALRKVGKNYLVDSAVKNEGLRRYHTQMLERTIDSLVERGPEERYTGTENILLRSDRIPEAARIFEECFERILALSQSTATSDSEVFHLGIHCIPLSQFRTPKSPRKKP